ncbi:hypothetical protein [Botrimarina mediterranea]|uniref:PEP-CTERM protein-sorting domain-containing protein n=1 Tax=Botrimarina mediterranea TaxID=2528022 RepID=A0A518KBX7_9BACT|nr:hypothetical protein [Botrimarina mediterranea]QDV75269.1 hypothetical protein Spa11_34830 [Botrimarina mediterranea]QDV79938.1 hypothetical protein K2D_35580 [Planctomycetes bacterium K2D]
MNYRLFALAMLLMSSVATAASITDFSNWTLVEDPAHPGMSATIDGPSQASLARSGPIPNGADIGFASVNGDTVSTSDAGWYFSPDQDFQIAIDFSSITSAGSVGAGVFGFGVGEDASGSNSAGIGVMSIDSIQAGYLAAGRVNDIDVIGQFFSTEPLLPGSAIRQGQAVGRMFLSYDSSTGDVSLGVSNTVGATQPEEAQTLSGIAESWSGRPLLVSFFLRSQQVPMVHSELRDGATNVQVGPLIVLHGTPITIPEPTSGVLAILGALGVLAVKKRTC